MLLIFLDIKLILCAAALITELPVELVFCLDVSAYAGHSLDLLTEK